ncbi:hypothetical protein P879_07820 [Paragonimus westermani]|uniref:KRR1 small subunit processome component n=2 Tax=Paragonimus westermani TaxID=34504 RepID=A0A8T0DSV1_9TREM|nr:hypothetical protein P879_07820 [Paragonimus westermani]
MVKKTKRQTFNFPEVAGWVPYQAFSSKKEILKETEPNAYVEVPKDWKEPEFKPEDNVHGRLFALSSYVTLFPKYREKYIKEIWPALKKVLLEYHIRAEVDLAESSMEVRTTPKTYDPFIILKARDVIRLLARSVPFEQAIRVLQDDMFADIIEINLANRERFLKRRNRLIGYEGETLKALELSTNCYIVIQGKTVSVIGHYEDLKQRIGLQLKCDVTNLTDLLPSGQDFRWYVQVRCSNCGHESPDLVYICPGERVALKDSRGDANLTIRCKFCNRVRKVVTGCIYDNIHPAYSIKRLLIIKKLKADPTKATVSWDRFLPKLTKKVLSRRRKPHKVRKKKEYTPFPPAPTPSKIDIELEKGTYFLAEAERKRIKTAAKISQSNKVSKERQAKKRAAAFVPPQGTKRSKQEPA